MRVAVVGLGKAGGSLLASARAAKVPVAAHSARLADLTRNARWLTADALFLAVPDDAIVAVGGALARQPSLPQLVVHMSGVRGVGALAALSSMCTTGAFHPLAALDGKQAIPARTFVAIDATTRAARVVLTSLATRMGLVPGHVAERDRVRYHAGAVIAGNLATALLHEGVQLLVRSGVPAAIARESLARLLASTARNAIAHPLTHALTGPVARVDRDTLRRHVALLTKEDPALASIYRALSGVLVDDVSAHDVKTRRLLRSALAYSSLPPPSLHKP